MFNIDSIVILHLGLRMSSTRGAQGRVEIGEAQYVHRIRQSTRSVTQLNVDQLYRERAWMSGRHLEAT
jgi:hypothetical protein